MEKYQLNTGEELISAKPIKLLKGGYDLNWCLLMCETDKKERIVVYATKNIPKLYKFYDLIVTKSTKPQRTNNYVLVNFYTKQKTLDRELELYLYLKQTPKVGFVAVDKIKSKFSFINFYSEVKNNNLFKEGFATFLSKIQKDNIQNTYLENKVKIDSLIDEREEINEDLFFFELNKIQSLYEKLKNINHGENDLLSYYKLNNPYKLYLEHRLNLADIDIFALALGYQTNSFERLEAYLNYSMVNLEEGNSTFWPTNLVVEMLQKTSNVFDLVIIEEFLKDMINKNKLLNVNGLLCRKLIFDKEKMVTFWLNKIKEANPLKLNHLTKKDLAYLSDKQKEAYYESINNNICIITGAPGTGKSNIIKHLYDTLKKSKLKLGTDFMILGPTGRVCSNLSKKYGFTSKTIHSFLSVPTDDERVTKSIEDFSKIKCLIIDEFSMVNLNIFYLLLSVCQNLQKLIILGDVNQLPAIGPGNILFDLIDSQKITTIYLEENFRSESQEIIDYINFINSIGDFKNLNYNQDFQDYLSNIEKLKINNLEANIEERIYSNFCDWYGNKLKKQNIELNIYNNYLSDLSDLFLTKVENFGIHNTIIICPMYKGPYGIDKINEEIQKNYNKDSDVIYKYKINEYEYKFKLNDKVIQLVNRYDDGVSNGDIGYITKFEKSSFDNKEKIHVQFDDKTIIYTKDEFKTEIKLAYAVTAHKFQGSEINCCIFVVNPNHAKMLYKKLVYTATSRAIKELVIFSNTNKIYSTIFLKEFLKPRNIITNLSWMLKE